VPRKSERRALEIFHADDVGVNRMVQDSGRCDYHVEFALIAFAGLEWQVSPWALIGGADGSDLSQSAIIGGIGATNLMGISFAHDRLTLRMANQAAYFVGKPLSYSDSFNNEQDVSQILLNDNTCRSIDCQNGRNRQICHDEKPRNIQKRVILRIDRFRVNSRYSVAITPPDAEILAGRSVRR